MMSKKHFFHASLVISLAWLLIGVGQAADFKEATTGTPAQILIQNAAIKTSSRNKFASMRLVAQDHKNLHPGQVYRAYFSPTQTQNIPDASYDVEDESLYIQQLWQASSLSHQTTLVRVKLEPLEFAITEMNTTVVRHGQDKWFDSSAVHKVSYYPEND